MGHIWKRVWGRKSRLAWGSVSITPRWITNLSAEIMDNTHIWDKTLGSGEAVQYEFSVGSRYRSVACILWCVFTFWTFISIPIAIFYYLFYLPRARVYAFTEHRVLIHTGWLSTKLISTDYQKITDVTVKEPFFQRLFFGTGTIEIDTAGTNRKDVILSHIEHPYEIKKKLDELRKHR
jgi:uncharacterized membrane protein YdbT with pleckstrin-like domain